MGLYFSSIWRKLGIDPASISKLILSHQHWDHIGGLPEILHANPGLTVYVPASFSENLKREIKKRADLVEIKEACRNISGYLEHRRTRR